MDINGELQEQLLSLTREAEGKFAFYVGNVLGEVLAEKDSHLVFPAASMIKVLIMETLYAKVRNSEVPMTKRLLLSDYPRTMGGGALQELKDDHTFTLTELCRLMMVLSDNWATNLLIHFLNPNTINERAKELGYEQTQLKRFMMDVKAREAGLENETSLADLKKLFLRLYRLRAEEGMGRNMWDMLGGQQFRDKLPCFWGEDIPFFHKTGSLEGVEHDGGIYCNAKGAYVIIVLSSGLTNNGEGVQTIAKMGQRIRSYLDDKG